MKNDDINTLLLLRDQLVDKKNKYHEAEKKCQSIVNSLEVNSNKLNSTSELLHAGFNISGRSIDEGRIDEISKNYSEISSKFSNEILAEIQNEIKKLQIEIDECDKLINNKKVR